MIKADVLYTAMSVSADFMRPKQTRRSTDRVVNRVDIQEGFTSIGDIGSENATADVAFNYFFT